MSAPNATTALGVPSANLSLVPLKVLCDSAVLRWSCCWLQGAEGFQTPLHLQVSAASKSAKQAVEQAGGSVTTVYYNQLGLRALLTPSFFAKKGRQLPRPAGAPTKVAVQYNRIGQLPPDRTLPASAA